MNENYTYPVLFTGHGSPMNAIGSNRARTGWQQMGKILKKPEVIIAVSAHWMTAGLYVRRSETNPQVFDMYGFPEELYHLRYEPKGSTKYADKVLEALGASAQVNNDWGIDHGVWSVLANMFPEADIPVVMVSTDTTASPAQQYETGRKLASLRREGALIIASGNIVHNLGLVGWDMNRGYPWAEHFDHAIQRAVLSGHPEAAVNYAKLPNALQAVPTVEHYYPFLVALGASNQEDKASVWNAYCELGSMSMTSYLFTAE